MATIRETKDVISTFDCVRYEEDYNNSLVIEVIFNLINGKTKHREENIVNADVPPGVLHLPDARTDVGVLQIVNDWLTEEEFSDELVAKAAEPAKPPSPTEEELETAATRRETAERAYTSAEL